MSRLEEVLLEIDEAVRAAGAAATIPVDHCILSVREALLEAQQLKAPFWDLVVAEWGSPAQYLLVSASESGVVLTAGLGSGPLLVDLGQRHTGSDAELQERLSEFCGAPIRTTILKASEVQ